MIVALWLLWLKFEQIWQQHNIQGSMKRTLFLSHVLGPMLRLFFDISADLMLFLDPIE